jgi:hypothetical protein
MIITQFYILHKIISNSDRGNIFREPVDGTYSENLWRGVPKGTRGPLYMGNLTRLAPIPNPAPPLALPDIDGTKTSSTLNVAAAVKAIMTTSSTFIFLCGITKAAIATMIPSTMYLIARLINSLKSNAAIMIQKSKSGMKEISKVFN